uniref:YqgF/RNase H-like domain-containing protein n=1 Tax=Parascaris univalens TaxID=6257 RepID=A0A915C8G9_PARUN
RRLLDKAERSAIDCFAKNMRELLLTAPLKGHLVLAIDPGYSSGCKCALVDASEPFHTSAGICKSGK